MEEVYKVTVSCPLAHQTPNKNNKVCKSGITQTVNSQGTWPDKDRTDLADRLAQHLFDVHQQPWHVALQMAHTACHNPTFWTSWEDKEWEANHRQVLGPVILTSAAAVPSGLPPTVAKLPWTIATSPMHPLE